MSSERLILLAACRLRSAHVRAQPTDPYWPCRLEHSCLRQRFPSGGSQRACCRFDAHSGVEHMTAGRSEASFAVSLDTIPTWFRGGRVVPFKERPRRSSVSMQVRCLRKQLV